MEFDKNKILTVVTADQAKVGQKGWFDDTLVGLKKKVSNSQPQKLIMFQPDVICNAVFLSESGLPWGLFYPAPEPTYRPFTNDELNDIVGKVVTSKRTGDNRMVSERDGLNLVHIGCNQYTAEGLLEWYTLDGHPCGVREEA